MSRRTEPVIGVDIGTSSIKAVELRTTGSQHEVAALGRELLPAGAVTDGLIDDAEIVSDALRRLLDRLHVRTRNVAAAVPLGAAVVKRIRMPAVSDVELAVAIQWEVEQHIPFHIDDVNFDYESLPASTGEEPGMMDVLVVAAKKASVARLAGVIRKAGATPLVVDAVPLALQNAYEHNYGEQERCVALVDAGPRGATVHVVCEGSLLLTREGHAQQPIVDLIRTTCDSAASSPPFVRVDRILLTGGGSSNVAAASSFDVPVELLDPFRRITSAAMAYEIDEGEAAATCAVAVGLALRSGETA